MEESTQTMLLRKRSRLWVWQWSEGWTVYTEQARAVETASGADGDNEECVETLRLTGRD
jgi:hypothetical protein